MSAVAPHHGSGWEKFLPPFRKESPEKKFTRLTKEITRLKKKIEKLTLPKDEKIKASAIKKLEKMETKLLKITGKIANISIPTSSASKKEGLSEEVLSSGDEFLNDYVGSEDEGVPISEDLQVLKNLQEQVEKLDAILEDQVSFRQKLGSGQEGSVYSGTYQGNDVAIKHCASGEVSAVREYYTECLILSALTHPNIVKFIGVVPEKRWLVIELCNSKSVYNSLDGIKDTKGGKESIIGGVLEGMEYLASEGVIHRDLAARNVLLSKQNGQYVAKIGDFGRAHQLANDEKVFRDTKEKTWPIKWMAPESIIGCKKDEGETERPYSEKTDVWSFGIFVCELITEKIPYDSMEQQEVSSRICDKSLKPIEMIAQYSQENNCYITKPEYNLSPEFIQLIETCFTYDPEQRPTFASINQEFKKNYS